MAKRRYSVIASQDFLSDRPFLLFDSKDEVWVAKFIDIKLARKVARLLNREEARQ